MKLEYKFVNEAQLKEAKISDKLINRLKNIEDSFDTKFTKTELFHAIKVLEWLKHDDDFNKTKIQKDENGFYQALYVKPEDFEDVEVIFDDGSEGKAYITSSLWYDSKDTELILGKRVKLWKEIEKSW